jgi:hypothetical protein
VDFALEPFLLSGLRNQAFSPMRASRPLGQHRKSPLAKRFKRRPKIHLVFFVDQDSCEQRVHRHTSRCFNRLDLHCTVVGDLPQKALALSSSFASPEKKLRNVYGYDLPLRFSPVLETPRTPMASKISRANAKGKWDALVQFSCLLSETIQLDTTGNRLRI